LFNVDFLEIEISGLKILSQILDFTNFLKHYFNIKYIASVTTALQKHLEIIFFRVILLVTHLMVNNLFFASFATREI